MGCRCWWWGRMWRSICGEPGRDGGCRCVRRRWGFEASGIHGLRVLDLGNYQAGRAAVWHFAIYGGSEAGLLAPFSLKDTSQKAEAARIQANRLPRESVRISDISYCSWTVWKHDHGTCI